MKQSCTVFIWFFILSGLENSFWHTGHGNTFRWWPSWYKKACRWKLYLFLNVFCTSTFAHSVHWYTPSLIEAYLKRFSPLTDISVNCSAGSWLCEAVLRRALLFTGCLPDGAFIVVVLVDGVVVVVLLLFILSEEFNWALESAVGAGDASSDSASCFGVNNFWLDGESVKCRQLLHL